MANENIPYIYSGETLPNLAAKSYNEKLGTSGITYIDPSASTYLNFIPAANGKYRFIPYKPGLLDNLWGATKATFCNYFKTDPNAKNAQGVNYEKLENVAKWGTAPIPVRLGLGNTSFSYTETLNISMSTKSSLTLTWNNSNGITRSDTGGQFTKASCIIVDLCAAGGNGGSGGMSGSGMFLKCAGGGGGGAGAAASLFVDLANIPGNSITFTKASDSLKVTYKNNNTNTTIITLGNGGQGGNGGTSRERGTAGVGGSVSQGTVPTGVKILWSKKGANGGIGGNNNDTEENYPGATWKTYGYGHAGENGPNRVTFITDDSIYCYAGGRAKSSADNLGAGGGGGGSLFSYGTAGTNYTYPTARAAVSGAGGGGGGACGSATLSPCTGGAPALRIFFETADEGVYTGSGATYYSNTATPTTDPNDTDTWPDGSGGGGGGSGPSTCVFPGTQIFLDKDTSVDILDYEPRSPLAYCDPETLEYSIQQSPAKLRYREATQKVTLCLEDGKSISITPDHSILTRDGFKNYLEGGTKYTLEDEVATIDGYKKLISIHEKNVAPTEVYNIITETNTMVANGIIVAGELDFNLEAAEARAARAARGVSTWALIGPGGSKEIM